MAYSIKCDRCQEAEAATNQINSGSNAPAGWVRLRISISPMLVSQISIDICPSCRTQLRIPEHSPAPGDRDAAQVIHDLLVDIAYDEVQNYMQNNS